MSDDAEVIPLRPELAEGDAPVRTRPRPPFCAHRSTELDVEARRVYCRTCGREVPAFDAMLELAREFERWLEQRDAAKREARRYQAELEDVKRELRNAKSRRRAQRKRADELAPRRRGA